VLLNGGALRNSGSSPDARSPSGSADETGKIDYRLCYAINEGAGVYWVTSRRPGMTWSEPTLIFDGSEAGGSVVDSPQLGGNRMVIHMTWMHETLIGNGSVIAFTIAARGRWSDLVFSVIIVEQPVEEVGSWV